MSAADHLPPRSAFRNSRPRFGAVCAPPHVVLRYKVRGRFVSKVHRLKGNRHTHCAYLQIQVFLDELEVFFVHLVLFL